ncbi:type IV pilus assembly protein PilB [Candidatus Moduliflexus flocculans]|uniref:Type IV pilus assembly protein PilB n=1 Tax=Candidatus Moduliflexus flocculans TaxID=1499966 RepID=A0A0S6VQK6_9BACT|nr:type IV pilus assembly protein PilB [Candidatus Moduliflexus flocculans]
MTKNAKELNLGEILRDAGLISPAQLAKAFQEQHASGSSLVEILTKKRYISKQSLVDLMTYEIPSPFSSSDADKALKELLLDTGLTTEEELRQLIDESELGRLLVQENYIKKFQLELARQEQAKTGLPLWRTLINFRFLTPNQMNAVLKEQMYRAQYGNLDELVGEILVNTRQITKEQLRRAQEARLTSSKPLAKMLIDDGVISASGLAKALGDHLKLPFVDVSAIEIDETAAKLLPESYLREHSLLPFKQEDAQDDSPPRIWVAMIDPLNIAARDNIGMILGCEVVPVVTTEKSLQEQLARLFPEPSVRDLLSQSQIIRPASDVTPSSQISSLVALSENDDVSIVKLVTSLIEGAIHANATDIHFEPQPNEDLRIRYRIDGLLHDVMKIPKQAHLMVISRIKVLADMDITERRQAQDGHLTMKAGHAQPCAHAAQTEHSGF